MPVVYSGTAEITQDVSVYLLDAGGWVPVAGTYHVSVLFDEGAIAPADHGYASTWWITMNSGTEKRIVAAKTVAPGGDIHTVEFDLTYTENTPGFLDPSIANVVSSGAVPSLNVGSNSTPVGQGFDIWGSSAASRHSNPQTTYVEWTITGGVDPVPPPPDPGDEQEVVDDDNVAVDLILNATDKVIRIERQGWGSGSFRTRRDGPDADTIGTGYDGRMVRVTIPRIDPNPIFRYMIENVKTVVADEGEEGEELISVSGRGALAYFGRAVSSPYTYVGGTVGPVEVHRGPAATGQKPGQMLRRYIAEAQHVNRPQQPIPLITIDFDYTNDSDGNPWTTTTVTDEMLVGYTGDSYLQALQELWGTGAIDFHIEYDGSMLLRAFNSYGRDLTGTAFGAGVVRFVKGVNIADTLARTRGTELPITYMWVEGDDMVFVDPPASLADAGSRPVVEGFIKTVGTNLTSLEAIGDAALLEALRRGESVAFNVAIVKDNELLDENTGMYLPGPPGTNGNFWVGDSVTIDTGTGVDDFDNEDVRIEAITIWFDDANNIKCKVEVKAVTIAGRLPPSAGGVTGVGFTGQPSSTGAGGTSQPPVPTSTALNDHLVDTVDAHDASAISVLDTGANFSSGTVEGALAEAMDEVQSHEADTTDAHDASAISFVPTGTIAATDVQAAIAEVASEASAGAADGHGAMAIRYVFSTTTTDSDPGSGNARLSNATQSSAVTLRLDLTDADGVDVTAVLDTIANWLSSTKGYVRIQHRTDPTKWLFGTMSAIASPSGYRNITIANVAKSTTSPLANGDPIVVGFLPGTLAHHTAHEFGGTDKIKLDDLDTPDDNTDLNASSTAHGLLRKLTGSTANFLRADGAWADPGAPAGSSFNEAIYGDGSDGDVTISVDTSLTRDMFYHNLTVNTGINLDTASSRIFVSGTLTLNGTIRNNGNAGGAGGNGTAVAGGAAGAAGAQQTGSANGILPDGPVGRAGAIGGINANGTGTTAGSNTDYGYNAVPAGTAGGVSGSGRNGGAGGGAGTSGNTVTEKPYQWPQITFWRQTTGNIINLQAVTGSAAQCGSGGGAAGAGGGGSGGSGSGGSIAAVIAKVITGNGRIEAHGGNGGQGGNGFATGQAGGGAGGNGGQGGIVVLIYSDASGWTGTLDVAGGTKGAKGLAGGGAGSTDGADGNDGTAGKSFFFRIS